MSNKISKRDYIISAGIVPVKLDDNKEPLFLMLRSWSLWEFPKGKKEPNETDLEAALRETEEEASIPSDRINFKWGKEYFETEPYRKKKDKIVRYFLGETNFTDIKLPINPDLGKPEHNEFKWVKYNEAKKMVNERILSVLNWAFDKISGK